MSKKDLVRHRSSLLSKVEREDERMRGREGASEQERHKDRT